MKLIEGPSLFVEFPCFYPKSWPWCAPLYCSPLSFPFWPCPSFTGSIPPQYLSGWNFCPHCSGSPKSHSEYLIPQISFYSLNNCAKQLAFLLHFQWDPTLKSRWQHNLPEVSQNWRKNLELGSKEGIPLLLTPCPPLGVRPMFEESSQHAERPAQANHEPTFPSTWVFSPPFQVSQAGRNSSEKSSPLVSHFGHCGDKGLMN